MAGIEPVKQRGPRSADMQETRGGWRKSRHHFPGASAAFACHKTLFPFQCRDGHAPYASGAHRGAAETSDAAAQRQWRMPLSMSSLTSSCEHFLSASGFDRGPWLVVAFAAGIASWFVLGNPWQWSTAIGAGLLLALSGAAIWRETEVPHLRAVVADRWLPRSCQPRWFKADSTSLAQSRGMAILLREQSIVQVADHQGEHGWWRAEPD